MDREIETVAELPAERRAPAGQIWRCMACGKRAEDRYGLVGWHDRGWDESCMLNASRVTGAAPAHVKEDQS